MTHCLHFSKHLSKHIQSPRNQPQSMAKTQRATNKSYLKEFQRQKILMLKSKGKTHAQIARTIKCSPSTVTYTLQHYKRHRSVENSPKPGRQTSIPPKILGYLKAALVKHQIKPLATTTACVNWLKSHFGLEINYNTLYGALQRTHLRTFIVKNKPPTRAKRDGRPHPGKEVVWDKPNTTA